eukprot:34153-Chlamydomonas_euryale.AAC.1
MELLNVLRRWVVDPYPGQQEGLTQKESVPLCQRLGALEKQGWFEVRWRSRAGLRCAGWEGVSSSLSSSSSSSSAPTGVCPQRCVGQPWAPLLTSRCANPKSTSFPSSCPPHAHRLPWQGTALRADWEAAFLELLKRLCTSPKLSEELRTEFFTKVERLFMAGLRSGSAATRADFFRLYHTHVPPTLYDRFHFIFLLQDWEAMAGQFWLTKVGHDASSMAGLKSHFSSPSCSPAPAALLGHRTPGPATPLARSY